MYVLLVVSVSYSELLGVAWNYPKLLEVIRGSLVAPVTRVRVIVTAARAMKNFRQDPNLVLWFHILM